MYGVMSVNWVQYSANSANTAVISPMGNSGISSAVLPH